MIQRLVRCLAPDFRWLWPSVAFDGRLAGAAVGGVLGVADAIAMICGGGVTLIGLGVLPMAGLGIGIEVGTLIGAFVGLLAGALVQVCIWSWLPLVSRPWSPPSRFSSLWLPRSP